MFIFPVHLFNPASVYAHPVARTLSGGVALSGDEDVIVTDGGGRWEIEYSGISLLDAATLRAWDAWTAYLDGGATPCLVPLVSLKTAPRPYADNQPLRTPPLVFDDPLWPTTVSFPTPYIAAEFTADADLRATTVELDVTLGGIIRGGEQFSVGERAYRIQRPGAGENEYVVRPPLREAALTGAEVNFNWPVVKCRLDPANELAPKMLQRSSDVAIRFVECD